MSHRKKVLIIQFEHKHSKARGQHFPYTSASSTVLQAPRRETAHRAHQTADFPASCKASASLCKHFAGRSWSYAVVIEALFKVASLCLGGEQNQLQPLSTTNVQMTLSQHWKEPLWNKDANAGKLYRQLFCKRAATELPLDGSTLHWCQHTAINHSSVYFPLRNNVGLQGMSVCKHTACSTAFWRTGANRLFADLRACLKSCLCQLKALKSPWQ